MSSATGAMQHLLSPNQQEIKREPYSPNRKTPQHPTTPSPNPYVPQPNLASVSNYQPQPDYWYAGNSSSFNELLLDFYKPNSPVIEKSKIADTGAVPSTSNAVGPTGTTMPITLTDTMNQLDQAANTQNPLDNSSYFMNMDSSLLNAENQLSENFLNFFNDPVQGTPAQQEQIDLVDNMPDSFIRMNLHPNERQ